MLGVVADGKHAGEVVLGSASFRITPTPSIPAGGYRTALRVEGDQVFQVTGAPTNCRAKLLDQELVGLTAK